MGRERKAVRGFVSALNEPGALDEMGIGRIRDTIADRAPTSMRNYRWRAAAARGNRRTQRPHRRHSRMCVRYQD